MKHLSIPMMIVLLLLLVTLVSNNVISATDELRSTNAHIYPVTRFLNKGIDAGWFPGVNSGLNRFSIPVPGLRKPIPIQLTIPTIELRIPGIYARMRIQSLRFRRFSLQFDGERQALRLRIYFHNQRNGVVGYYKVGPLRHPLRLHVKRAQLNVYLKPYIQDGHLTFQPLEVELSFYEGNIPGMARPVLSDAIQDAIETSTVSLQRQFDRYIPEFLQALEEHAFPTTQLRDIVIEEGSVTFRTRSSSASPLDNLPNFR